MSQTIFRRLDPSRSSYIIRGSSENDVESWRPKKTHVEDEFLHRLEVGAVVAYETEGCKSEEDLESQCSL